MSFLFNAGSMSSGGHVPPSVPRSLSVTGGCQANGANPQYSISWLHPTTVAKWDYNSNPTVTTDLKYTVTVHLASNNNLVGTTGASTITSTGGSVNTSGITLTAGTLYYMRVTAAAYGFTSLTNSSNFTAITFPGNVGTVSVTPGNAQVTVSWSAVNNGGGSVSYNVTIFTSAGSQVSTTNTSSTSANITGLSNGTTYYARVYAYNECGQTAASQSTNFTPVAPPVTPPIIAVTPPIIAVTPPIIAVTPPIIAVTPPIIAVTPPIIAVTPPIIAVTPPIIAVTPPIIAVTPPIIAVTPPIIAVTPPIIAVTPPIIAVTPPIIAVTPPIIAVTPPIIATPPCTGCVRDECWYPCPPCCSICGC